MDVARHKALTVGAASVAGLACVLWLIALGLLVRQLVNVGSPPRIASWEGPIEDDNLPEDAFLFEDEVWSIRDAPDRPTVVRIDLARGVAQTGWDLTPFGPDSLRVEGVARRDDGALTLVIQRRGLRAITLTREREVVDHGTARIDTLVGVIGVRWVGATLHVALGDGRDVSFREGAADVQPIEGSPRVDWRTRDRWLAAARWSDTGWDVLVWEAPDRWRWTRGDTRARPEWAATYGGLSVRHRPFDAPIHVGPPELGPPPNAEVHVRAEPGRALRWLGEDRWENGSAAGGFWDWCLPRGARWVCVSHDAFEHETRLFDDEGHDGSASIHGRFSPADPVIVHATEGGFWVLDLSNTSEDGRIYYRLNDDLSRADPLSWSERYRRARPRTHEEARAWQATSGPSVMAWSESETVFAVTMFLATIELPIEVFTFPIAMIAFLIAASTMRVRGRGAAFLALAFFGAQLGLALLSLPGFLQILPLV
jgi:hypothetical protein